MSAVYSIAYLPPVSYLQSCLAEGVITIDSHEHFVKQTYRNRCCIYGPNGKQNLVIPLQHENIFRTAIKNVKIANEEHWQINHWRSIESAYRNSPFFEYYEDQFRPFYEKKYDFLFDFNMELLEALFKWSKKKIEIRFTDEYKAELTDSSDYRQNFHPKKNVQIIKPYHQVFADKHGFIPDLSAIDLLFNTSSF